MINEAEIRRFFKFLNDKAEYFSVSIMDKESKGPLGGFGFLYEKVDSIIATLKHFEDATPTLHVTLNETDDKGRKKGNVTGTRVLCCDIDRYLGAEEVAKIWAELSPHLLVLSSKGEGGTGKFHVYWKITGLTLEAWQHYQLAIAYRLGGDLGLDSVAKTIRVPGCERIQKDGTKFMPAIVGDSQHAPHTLEDLHALFSGHEEDVRAALEARKEEARVRATQIKEIERQGPDGTVVIEVEGRSGRNTALWHEVYKKGLKCVKATGIGDATFNDLAVSLKDFGETINAAFGPESGGPLEESERDKTIESAIGTVEDKWREISVKRAAEAQVQRELLERVEEAAQLPTNGDGTLYQYDYGKGALADGRFSTLATVERVMQRYGRHLARVDGELYAFSPVSLCWKPQKPHATLVSKFVHTCTRDILRDPMFLQSYTGDKVKAAIEKFEGHAFLQGVKTQIVESHDIPEMDGADFDKDEYLFLCKSGVLDLRGVAGAEGAEGLEVRDARLEDYLLQRSRVKFVKGAKCPRWLKFLEEIFADNHDVQGMCNFMQQIFGYSLTGSISAQKLFVHSGGGSNGKSKVLQALAGLMGGYCTMMSGQTFAKSPNGFEKALERIGVKIEGKRVVIVDDMDSKTQWNEGLVKNLTGPVVLARKLYQEERDIPNRAKFHLGCNERPVPQSENYGILRRLCIIPYNRQFQPLKAKEDELQAMIVEEQEGRLNWALEGLRQVLAQGGLKEPGEVEESLEEYKEEHFCTDSFVRELFCVPSPEAPEKNKWHELGVLVKMVNEALEQKGLISKRFNPVSLGILLKAEFGAEVRRTRKGSGTRIREICIGVKSNPVHPAGISVLR